MTSGQSTLSSRIVQVGTRVLRSGSVQVAAWIGAGGVALMAANLLFAGLYSPEDFGRLALVQGLLSIGVGVAPIGLDLLAARGDVPSSLTTVRYGAIVGVLGGMLLGIAGVLLYQLPWYVAIVLAVGCLAGAVARICTAFDQAALRLNRAQAVYQSPYLVTLLAAVVLTYFKTGNWVVAAAALAAGYAFAALTGLIIHARRSAGDFTESTRSRSFRMSWPLWRRGMTFVGIAASVLVLIQSERLIIPRVLTLQDLALFSIVATLVGSPYRLLWGGIGYALLPRLSGTDDPTVRRRLVKNEALLALAGCLIAASILLPIAAPLIHMLYRGKYIVPSGLVLAVVVLGTARVSYGVASATVNGLCDDRGLKWANRAGWIATLGSLGLGLTIGRLGIIVIVLINAVAWAARAVVAFVLASPFLWPAGRLEN